MKPVADPTDRIRTRHRQVQGVRHTDEGLENDGPAVCLRCPTSGWPCDAHVLCDEVDRLRAALDEHANALVRAGHDLARLRAIEAAARSLCFDPVPADQPVTDTSWVRVHERARDALWDALEATNG